MPMIYGEWGMTALIFFPFSFLPFSFLFFSFSLFFFPRRGVPWKGVKNDKKNLAAGFLPLLACV